MTCRIIHGSHLYATPVTATSREGHRLKTAPDGDCPAVPPSVPAKACALRKRGAESSDAIPIDKTTERAFIGVVSKGENTRREIVEEALALAGSVGLEGVSLGALAERLKLSKSGLFAHFKSKEALQLEVLQTAIDAFVKDVVLPAVTKARGAPRVRALAQSYMDWIRGYPSQGSCIFMALTHEYDDRPGQVRDLLVQSQRDWHGAIAKAARIAVQEGHFAADLDPQQFAFTFVGIGMAFQQSHKLLEDSQAESRARRAFDELIERSSRTPRS